MEKGKPAAEFAGAAEEFRNLNEAVNRARAAHGLPPIHPPAAPVAGPARSLLIPPNELQGARAGAAPIVERVGPGGTERLVPTPRPATAREAGVSTIIERPGATVTERIAPRPAPPSTPPALPKPTTPATPAIRPTRAEVANSAPLQGHAAMSEAELASFAKRPRVRTREDPSRLEGFGDLAPVMKEIDPVAAVEARARWLKVPREAKVKLDADFRAAVDEAAAVGDKWARKLQAELNAGTFNFRYEPGIGDFGGFAMKDSAIVNPFEGGRLLTGEELSRRVVHEYVHTFAGPKKYAADLRGFAGVADKGKYNEGRAFLAESIFERNLARARQLNGKPFDLKPDEFGRMLATDAMPAGMPAITRGREGMRNLQEYLVDRVYGHRYAHDAKLAAERLAAFRGGSMDNTRAWLNKQIREKVMAEGDDAAAHEALERLSGQIESELLMRIEQEGGRFLP